MLSLNNLRPSEGSTHAKKRLGRGEASGKGGTASRGHKGDKARSGHKNKRHHEGGQMPLQMRLPKRGFKNINRVEYIAFNLDRLEEVATKHNTTDITTLFLLEHGYIRATDLVKVLGNGELTQKLNLTVDACSENAKKAVEAIGGVVTIA